MAMVSSLLLLCLFYQSEVAANCVSNISHLPHLEPYHYNGSWFVIARKGPAMDYLPAGINSSLIRLTASTNDSADLDMVEYHSMNGTCMPPVHGRWLKRENGFLMQVRNPTGSAFEIFVRAIYHAFSGEQNEEMNMVIYGCRVITKDNKCALGEELTSILSNSRHPQTLTLFQSAKHIEDNACIDILLLKTLNTYTSCGDEVVDEDQKLRHASIDDEDNTFVDVECRVENFKAVDISKFFDEPRMLTVTAYIDPMLEDEQIAHVSCLYTSKTEAVCEWIRQRTCFKTSLTQSLNGSTGVQVQTKMTRMNGSIVDVDWSGSALWQNGDEYISMHCLKVDEDDGSCESYRVYVWSDEDHMDQPTIREIYNALHSACIDPSDLIFLNTFHECSNESSTELSDVQCSEPPGWSPVGISILQGVWYFAADLNAAPKIFMISTVIQLTPRPNDSKIMDLSFYAQRESDRECLGPGNGTVQLLNDSILEVTVEYVYRLVKYKNIIKWRTRIIYLDNQRMVLYHCFRTDRKGACIQKDVDILVRARQVSHNDVSLLLPYLERACVYRSRLRWFDLHSSCGTAMSASTKLRRDMVTLTHAQVLDILTNVQEPRCKLREMRGVRADFGALERAGMWYMISVFDRLPHDTFAMVARFVAVSERSAIVRLIQSAALPGEPKQCFTRVLKLHAWRNGEEDWVYETHHVSSTNQSITMMLRFLFFNGNVGVLYSCLGWAADGTCPEGGLYVISRYSTIDHAELAVLETVSRTICMDPAKLYHCANHDVCVYDTSRLRLPACASIESVNNVEQFRDATVDDLFFFDLNATAANAWEEAMREERGDSHEMTPLAASETADYGVFYAIAAANVSTSFFALARKDGKFVRISSGKAGAYDCIVKQTRVRLLDVFQQIALVDNELVLLARTPEVANFDLLLRAAQRSSTLPCLHATVKPAHDDCSCALLTPPPCASSQPIRIAEQLNGDWVLYSSDPYVAKNARCTVASSGTDEFRFMCASESWQGECEREVVTRIRADAWGGFRRVAVDLAAIQDSPETPVRTPSELFDVGNLTVTDDFLLLFVDDSLVGRRYSLWSRAPSSNVAAQRNFAARPFGRPAFRELARHCIWPTPAHRRSREKNC